MKYLSPLLLILLTSCAFVESLDSNRYPPNVDLEVTPSEGEAPLPVEIRWDISDDDGNALSCTIVVEETEQRIEDCPLEGSIFYTFTQVGDLVVEFNASDGEFNTSASRGVKVNASEEEPAETRVELTATPQTGRAPLLVGFEWRVSGLDDQPCTLDFGDGQSVAVENCTRVNDAFHTYEQAGGFVAELRFDGGAGATTQVRVEEADTP